MCVSGIVASGSSSLRVEQSSVESKTGKKTERNERKACGWATSLVPVEPKVGETLQGDLDNFARALSWEYIAEELGSTDIESHAESKKK